MAQATIFKIIFVVVVNNAFNAVSAIEQKESERERDALNRQCYGKK